MKQSFFIALAIYLVAGMLLWQMEWLKRETKETKHISLASLTIKKPSCQCKKCTCKSHMHKPKEVKSFQKPQEVKRELVKPKPKKVKPKQKKRKKVAHKKRVVHKRALKRKKVTKKVRKSVAKKPLQKAAKNSKTHPVPKENTSLNRSVQTKSAPAKLPPKAPQPSYQERYLRTYADHIRQAILRHKFYPRIARKTKKQGVVELYFELTPKKELKHLKVMRSSGHAILDRAAMKCVKEASSEFPAPKECVKVRVPIEYRLR